MTAAGVAYEDVGRTCGDATRSRASTNRFLFESSESDSDTSLLPAKRSKTWLEAVPADGTSLSNTQMAHLTLDCFMLAALGASQTFTRSTLYADCSLSIFLSRPLA